MGGIATTYSNDEKSFVQIMKKKYIMVGLLILSLNYTITDVLSWKKCFTVPTQNRAIKGSI